VAVHRRERASDNFIGHDNIGLAMMRQASIDREYSHVLAVKKIADNRAMYSNRGIMAASPLWLYPRDSTDLLDATPHEKTLNLAPEFVAALAEAAGETPSPEDTLAWIYAILYAPSYRARYADFLKRDFPRVPLPPSRDLFKRLVAIGRELIALHTMEAAPPRITGFPVAGSNEVTKPRWAPDAVNAAGRIYINAEQYFDKLPTAVWDMHIGGYRVAEKWLKDRKGRTLSYDDLTHYQAMIAALARTLELQQALDAAIDAPGGWPFGDLPAATK
jgi:predicted helicase